MPKPIPVKARPADKPYDIPVVSFRIITDDKSMLGPAGVHSDQARHYGYNDFSDFERPEHYIRYIEPIESELAIQVEYDMDEQDQEWLDVVNAERRKDQAPPVTYEMFEIIMDKLEKEWFNLIKRIPQPPSNMPVEDSKCAICDDGEGENSNAIVFCDGCNLAVHQDCYGVPYIPEGQWLCRKCTVSPENPVSCLFCPNEGGAFKQTTTGHWSHLLCAIWIPELSVGNAVYMEPVEGVQLVPKNRWKLVCSLCKERVGACIQCENKSCFTAFHVTCARQMGLLMSMKLMGADGQLRAYCDKHLPADWREGREEDTDDNDDDYHETESDEDVTSATPVPKKRGRKNSSTMKTVTPKTARAHTKSYRPGPPIVPRMIVNKLLDYVAKLNIRKKQQFIERLCRYWSLKREARRGAPLLKRLHLEPWTATSESREQTDAEKAKKFEFLVQLRNDLEKVRLLAELVRKREKEKLRQALVIQEIVDNFIFRHYITLRETLAKIVAMNKSDLFLHPVSREDVPDYYDVIKEPMSWSEIEEKLDQMLYLSTAAFKRDVLLVLDNAMVYNKSETAFHRSASRIKKLVLPLLDELDLIRTESSLMPINENDLVLPDAALVGDLEPSLLRLKALLRPTDPGGDMLASIFAFEAEAERDKSTTAPPPRKERPRPPPIRDPTRSTRSAPVAVLDVSSPAEVQGPSGSMRTTRSGVPLDMPSTPATPATPALSIDPLDEKDRARQEALLARRERERESRLKQREAARLKKQKAEEEKVRKRDRERERRRLKKLEEARARGEIVDDDHEGDCSVVAVNEVEVKQVKEEVKEASEEERPVDERQPAIMLGDTTAGRDVEAKTPQTEVLTDEERDSEPKDAEVRQPEHSEGAAEMVLAQAQEPNGVNKTESVTGDKETNKPGVVSGHMELDETSVVADTSAEDKPREVDESDAVLSAEHAKPQEDVKPEELEVGEPKPQEQDPDLDDIQMHEPSDPEVQDKNVDDQQENRNGSEPPSSPGGIKPTTRPERGVLGLQSIPVLTDRERRQAERQLDLITTTVDPLEEYKRFNVGWILPEGSKRKRVSAPPPILVPPAKKARRTSKTPSVSHSDSVSVKSDLRSERKGKEREEKEKRKSPDPSSPGEELTPIPESAQASAATDKFPHMERSSLSSPPEDTPKAKQPRPNAPDHGSVDWYSPGTHVWAKAPSYPYFPAVIVDPVTDRKRVPQTVLDLEESETAAHGKVWLARFYDKTQSWSWVPLDRLYLLGDEENDELFLAGKERVGGKTAFKSSHVKTSCRNAYKLAKDAMAKK